MSLAAARLSVASAADAGLRVAQGAALGLASASLKRLRSRGFKQLSAALGAWVGLELVWWSVFRCFFIPKLTSFKPEDQGKHISEVHGEDWAIMRTATCPPVAIAWRGADHHMAPPTVIPPAFS